MFQHFLGNVNSLFQGAGAYKLKTHVVGSLVHGRGKFFFVDYNQYPHDTNLVLSCLLRILQRVSQEQTNSLPATLYVQLDNTCRYVNNRSLSCT